MPLCRPAIAALATLELTFIYNDFFWALMLMKTGDRRPITAALNNLQGQFFTDFNLLAAAALLVALPTIDRVRRAPEVSSSVASRSGRRKGERAAADGRRRGPTRARGRGRVAHAQRPARGPPRAGRQLAVPAPPPPGRGRRRCRVGHAVVPGLWTMQGTWDRPQYTNVQMPFPDLPAGRARGEPTGVYERTFELPAALAGRPRGAPRRRRGERAASSQVNGVEVGVSKDSHLAAEFDITSAVSAGREHAPADGRQVVRRDVHRGPGPVVARRHHALRLPCTRPAGLPRRHPGRSAGLADDLTTGTLELDVLVAFAGGEPTAGGSRRRSRAVDGAFRASRRVAPLPRGATRARATVAAVLQRLASEWHAIDDELAADWAAMSAGRSSRRRRLVRRRVDVPDVTPWSAEDPPVSGALTVRAARPGRVDRGGSVTPRRLPTRRGRGLRPADQRPAGPASTG